jgi:hypothetical protein
MTRILGLVRSCADCPNKRYYSGSQHECGALSSGTDSTIIPRSVIEDKTIAGFCPLITFPSREIAAMHTTIDVLSAKYPTNMFLAILSVLAGILKVQVSPEYRIELKIISQRDFPEGEIYISRDNITRVDLRENEISFLCKSTAFKLGYTEEGARLFKFVDAECTLYEEVEMVR